jgi:acetolactate synthase-1/2/3 large subunit
MNHREFSVADQIANFIAEKNTPAVFQLSGGMIAFISDAISRLGRSNLVNLKHEQSAGFAGEGISRISGIPAVVLATSGPGATNLITPIASCFFDSTPVVFITGQVHSSELKKSKAQRQNGFQELEIVDLVKSIVKFATRIEKSEDVLPVLEKAWKIAQEGRPGPVLIDIPIDLQQHIVDKSNSIDNNLLTLSVENLQSALKELEQLIAISKFPLILLGGGIRNAKSAHLAKEFVETSGIPAVYSLMGKDVLPEDLNLNFGFIGSYGNRASNQSMMQSDLLIVLGSRLDIRQTGSSVSDFVNGRRIFRVDVDKQELEGRVIAEFSHQYDLNLFLRELIAMKIRVDSGKYVLDHKERLEKFPPSIEQVQRHGISPAIIMKAISLLEAESDFYIVDVGQHQMWAAQSIQLQDNQRFLTSGGLGAMGFSIPAAIGAGFISRNRVAVIIGDGCAQLSLNELETIRFYDLPITIYVINNEQHGMVAQFQEENMDSSFVGTREGYSTPNFAKVAGAYGIVSHKITSLGDLTEMESCRKNQKNGPLLFDVTIHQDFKALPKLGSKLGLKDL